MNKSSIPNLQYGGLISEDEYTKKRIDQTATIIANLNFNNYKILDIGGYNGDLLVALKEKINKPIDYAIVDFDEEAMRVANSRGIKTYFNDLDAIPFNTNIEKNLKFNVVISTECFEHLKDPSMHMNVVKDILKSDGYMIVSLPNENTLYHRLLSLFGIGLDTYAFRLYKHLHMPTIKQSETFLSKYSTVLKKDYWVSAQFKYTKMKFLSFLNYVPYNFWKFLANLMPNLFARGTIFTLKIK